MKLLGSLRPLVWVSAITNLVGSASVMAMESSSTIYPFGSLPRNGSSLTTYPLAITAVQATVGSIFPTILVTYSNHTLITRTVGPSPTLAPSPVRKAAKCTWQAVLPAPSPQSQNPPRVDTTAPSESFFTPSAFFRFIAALSTARFPLPKHTDLGFNVTEHSLYWINEVAHDKRCIGHLFHRESDIRVSICLPTTERTDPNIEKIHKSPPMKEIIATLKTIETDIQDRLVDPSQTKGAICVWGNVDAAGRPSNQTPSPQGEANIRIIRAGNYTLNSAEPMEGLPDEEQMVGWFLGISGQGKEFQTNRLSWGSNLRHDMNFGIKWDIIKSSFTPNDPKPGCSYSKEPFGQFRSQRKTSETGMKDHVYSAINSTINSLRVLSEDLFVSSKNNTIIRVIDEKDGDCVRKFCGGREDLTVSLCGFKSFDDLKQLDSENNYNGALNNRELMSDLVNYLRHQLESAALWHYDNPGKENNKKTFGPILNQLMCAFNSSNDTSVFPGTLKIYLGRKNSQLIPECEEYQPSRAGCGHFRLEINSKACTMLSGTCNYSKKGDRTFKDAVSVGNLIKARDSISSGSIARKFAQNLLGQTPPSWERWTRGLGSYYQPDNVYRETTYDQFFCDYDNNVKVSVYVEDKAKVGGTVDYNVPTKHLTRGLNFLIQEFNGAGDKDGGRISRNCQWGDGEIQNRQRNKTLGYFGFISSYEYKDAGWGPGFNNYPESTDWPWRFNITRLYPDDPCKDFSPIPFS
ncbi:hypothetical protein TWF718_002134 [Orbilia javanica]|uniref:Uncharacterized protein n=1 Tax=Orbilia javanica TaxID=47235 RepID=A0AAN8MJM1_9PEZI